MSKLPFFEALVVALRDCEGLSPEDLAQVVVIVASTRPQTLLDVAEQVVKYPIDAISAACAVAAAHEIAQSRVSESRQSSAKSQATRARDAERLKVRRDECDAETWAVISAAVLRRDGFRCRYCGTDEGAMEADHVFPVIRGGRSFMSNLVCSCRPCNSAKGARTPEEWGVEWP